ncbi:hypothetical protein GGF32_003017 [Allomyces javanicus]|nr:hypothetical protein GGF32_003017 [Allomyces javanicus]
MDQATTSKPARGAAQLIAELTGHAEPVWSLSWHPSGALLASSSSDKTVRIWGPVNAQVLSSAKSSGVSTLQPHAWDCKSLLDGGHKRTVRSVAFAPNGNVLATASFDATIGIWDKDPSAKESELEYDYAATLEGHENEAKAVAWSADGGLLATCSRDKSVWIWEVLEDNDFECLSVLQEHTQDVKMVKWHPTEEVLASVSYDDTIRFWKDDHDDWYCTKVVQGHESTVWGIDFDRDGRHFVTCSDDLSLRVWQYDSADSIHPVTTVANAHTRPIYSVAWNKHRPWIASSGGDNTVIIWEWTGLGLVRRSVLDRPHGECDVNCVAWNPHPALAHLLATCGDDGVVRIWQIGE